MSNWSQHLQIILPIISFVFGIFGGKLLEKIIDPLYVTETKSMLIGIFIVGLLTVISLIYITVFARRAEKYELDWHQTIQTMQKQIGIPAELIFERVYESKGMYYRKLIDLIKQATSGDEILIMTRHENAKSNEDPTETEDHKKPKLSTLKLCLKKLKRRI